MFVMPKFVRIDSSLQAEKKPGIIVYGSLEGRIDDYYQLANSTEKVKLNHWARESFIKNLLSLGCASEREIWDSIDGLTFRKKPYLSWPLIEVVRPGLTKQIWGLWAGNKKKKVENKSKEQTIIKLCVQSKQETKVTSAKIIVATLGHSQPKRL